MSSVYWIDEFGCSHINATPVDLVVMHDNNPEIFSVDVCTITIPFESLFRNNETDGNVDLLLKRLDKLEYHFVFSKERNVITMHRGKYHDDRTSIEGGFCFITDADGNAFLYMEKCLYQETRGYKNPVYKLPGGAGKSGIPSITQTCARIKEEIGTDLSHYDVKILGAYHQHNARVYPTTRSNDNAIVYYICVDQDTFNPNIKEPNWIKSARWHTPAEMQDILKSDDCPEGSVRESLKTHLAVLKGDAVPATPTFNGKMMYYSAYVTK